MKKSISILLVLLMIVSLCAVSAYAAEPRWTNVASMSPIISAASDMYGNQVAGMSGTTRIACTLVLYEKGWFSYSEVARTSETYNGSGHFFYSTYDIKSGKKYRLDTTVTVTRNGVDETVTTSFEKQC